MRFVAFLRAVNVGGRVVKMDELKQLFDLPGLKNISTYIQSGNVLFESRTTDADALTKKIENKLQMSLGYEVTVFLKTFDELKKIITQNPYDVGDMDLYISMLSAHPSKEHINALEAMAAEAEQLAIIHTEAYILCPKKTYGKSKLSNVNVEKKLKVKATTRNWTTMNKILELE